MLFLNKVNNYSGQNVKPTSPLDNINNLRLFDFNMDKIQLSRE